MIFNNFIRLFTREEGLLSFFPNKNFIVVRNIEGSLKDEIFSRGNIFNIANVPNPPFWIIQLQRVVEIFNILAAPENNPSVHFHGEMWIMLTLIRKSKCPENLDTSIGQWRGDWLTSSLTGLATLRRGLQDSRSSLKWASIEDKQAGSFSVGCQLQSGNSLEKYMTWVPKPDAISRIRCLPSGSK